MHACVKTAASSTLSRGLIVHVSQPLEFNRTMQQLRWNNGTRLSIPGTWVDKGTNPIGSTWAK